MSPPAFLTPSSLRGGMRMSLLASTALLFISFGLTGCAGSGSMMSSHEGHESHETHDSHQAQATHDSHHASPATTEGDRFASLEALYWARLDSAKMRFNDDDVMFMVMMIPHHSQALIMSALAEPNGASLEVRTLASRIINAQKDEIRTMLTWLQDRGQPYPDIHIDGLMMTVTMMEGEAADKGDGAMDHGMMDHDGHGESHDMMDHDAMGHGEGHGDMDHSDMDHHGGTHGDMNHHSEGHGDMDHSDMDHHGEGHGDTHGDGDVDHDAMGHGAHDIMTMDHSTMVGMLTQAQLVELSEAKGRDFDRLFLKFMIQHHNGAVVMVTDLFAADGAIQSDVTYKIASDIQVDQRTEIARMQKMLDRIEAELGIDTP